MEEEKKKFIRDVTSVLPKSKSEVRRRLNELFIMRGQEIEANMRTILQKEGIGFEESVMKKIFNN